MKANWLKMAMFCKKRRREEGPGETKEEEAWRNGWVAGWLASWQKGWEAGFQKGHQEGWEDAMREGFEAGRREVWADAMDAFIVEGGWMETGAASSSTSPTGAAGQ